MNDFSRLNGYSDPPLDNCVLCGHWGSVDGNELWYEEVHGAPGSHSLCVDEVACRKRRVIRQLAKDMRDAFR